MVMVGYDHQDEEAVIYVAYFKIICAMAVERRDKGSALFHISTLLHYLPLKEDSPQVLAWRLHG